MVTRFHVELMIDDATLLYVQSRFSCCPVLAEGLKIWKGGYDNCWSFTAKGFVSAKIKDEGRLS